ncbi:MAG: type II secretion system GspH family protein [Puniceicoccales bacterium]|jgi:prepilin-type N-terminal cleavage/methylation domain-containing protein|nr:type II secretion system GspH family protein [Puniceicoccales bacterium]
MIGPMGKEKCAFTLIEILAVIAVIGILAGLLFPSVGNMIDRARKMEDASNMRQIAIAYMNYLHDNYDRRDVAQCKNLYEFANVLARRGYLDSPEVYFSNSDPLVSSSRLKKPKLIGKANGGPWRPSDDFLKFPLSVVVVTNISAGAPASTTPIIYSRGLDVNTGAWKKDGMYGEEGGFIAFLDGHVRFFNNVTDEESQMLSFYTGDSTTRLPDALNHGAKALSSSGVEWESK